MDKLRNLSFVTHLRDFMENMKSGGMNPNLAWRVIIASSLITLGVISAGAYFTLNWAQSVDEAAVSAQRNRDTLSSEDLRGVVEIYTAKEAAYKELHQSRPTAPNLKMGSKVENTNVNTESATTSEEVGRVSD